MAQDLRQQPARIATRTTAEFERLLGSLHTRLHADQVAGGALQALIQSDQEIDGTHFRAVGRSHEFSELWASGCSSQKRRQLPLQRVFVAEGELLGVGFQEKIER